MAAKVAQLLFLVVLLCFLMSCSQGGRGGVSIPGDSYLVERPIDLGSKSVFIGQLSLRKKVELSFDEPESVVIESLKNGVLSSLQPKQRVDYSFDDHGRLEREITTVYRENVDNFTSIIPFSGAVLRERVWLFSESTPWQTDTIYEVMFGFSSDTDNGQLILDSTLHILWEDEYAKVAEEGVTTYTYGEGVRYFDKEERVLTYQYDREELSANTVVETDKGYSFEHHLLYDSTTPISAIFTKVEHLGFSEEYHFSYSLNRALDEYTYFRDSSIVSHNRVEYRQKSLFKYLYKNVLTDYSPRVRVETIEVAESTRSFEYEGTKVTFYELGHCHESNIINGVFGPPHELACQHESAWSAESIPISKKFSNGGLLNREGKCIHPMGGERDPSYETPAVLWRGCEGSGAASFVFELNTLRLKDSDTCLLPTRSTERLKNGSVLTFNKCDSDDFYFSVTSYGQIQLDGTSLCVQADSLLDGALIRLKSCSEKEVLQVFTTSLDAGKKLSHSSGLCLSPPENPKLSSDLGVDVILSTECFAAHSNFTLLPNGMLLHPSSGQCIHPQGGELAPDNFTRLVFFPNCDERDHLKFEFTDMGSLKHKLSGKCIHPENGASIPDNGNYLVLYDGCDESRLLFKFE